MYVMLTAVLVMSAPFGAVEEPPSCDPPTVVVTLGDSLVSPTGYSDTATVSTSSGAMPVPSPKTQWDDTHFKVLSLAAETARVYVTWAEQGDSKRCRQELRPDTPAGENMPASETQHEDIEKRGPEGFAAAVGLRTWGVGDCYEAGSDWLARIKTRHGVDTPTVLVFSEDQGICFRNRGHGVYGDPIYVGMFTTDPLDSWKQASFEPCQLAEDAPAIFVSDELPKFPVQQAEDWYLVESLPRRCFNTPVTLTVPPTEGGAQRGRQAARTALQQYKRYRATVQLGVVFSDLRTTTFGLRSDGQQNVIFAKDPLQTGPEYVAAFVFYSALRHLGALGTDKTYHGRDIVNDNSLIDRIGVVLGVGLQDPQDRFVAGFTVEALPGINLLAAWDFARISSLDGYTIGDTFVGDAATLPLREEWETGFHVGLALDLRYAQRLFSR